MVLTGAVLFFGMPEESSGLMPLTGTSLEVHEIFATIVWIYWGGHVALAVPHEVLARDGSLNRTFRFG
jgi:cytochrome b561